MPPFCYFWINGRLVGLVYGQNGFFELGLKSNANDLIGLNETIGVNRHDLLAMAICALFESWDKVEEIEKMEEYELNMLFGMLLDKKFPEAANTKLL